VSEAEQKVSTAIQSAVEYNKSMASMMDQWHQLLIAGKFSVLGRKIKQQKEIYGTTARDIEAFLCRK